MIEKTSRPQTALRARLRIPPQIADLSTLLVLIVLLIAFGVTSNKFLLPVNLSNILSQMSIVGVLAIGMTGVILIGGIDLSVGSVILLSGGVTSVLISNNNVPAVPAILVGLLAGAAVGLLNGVLVEIAGISPVIATLGTLIAMRGLGQIIINNTWVWVNDPLFEAIAVNKIVGVPMMFVITLVLYIMAAVLLRQTRFGRYTYAIGGNQLAARLAGLPVLRTKILTYVLSGLLAGVAGMLMVASLGEMGPSVGTGYEFDAIAAVVLGGVSLSGGIGRVEKTLLGAIILGMVLNYLTLRHIQDIWQQTVTGFLVLSAVLIDQIAQRTRRT